MAKESPKPTRGLLNRKSARARRAAIRPSRRSFRTQALDALATPGLAPKTAVALLFVIAVGLVMGWSRVQPLVVPGMVAPETRLVREAFSVPDPARTEQAREAARQRQPRVFSVNQAALDAIRKVVSEIPVTASQTDGPDTEEPQTNQLAAAATGELASQWADRVTTLMAILERNPILTQNDYLTATRQGSGTQIELVVDDNTSRIPKLQALSIDDAETLRAQTQIFVARNARFPEYAVEPVVNAILDTATPTFIYDAAQTAELEATAAAAVEEQVNTRAEGEIIYRAGTIITQQEFEKYIQERDVFKQSLSLWERTAGVAGSAALALAAALLLAGGLGMAAPHHLRSFNAVAWIVAITAVATAAACAAAVIDPARLPLATALPVLLATVLALIGFGPRAAGLIGTITAGLITIGLSQPSPWFITLAIGVWTAVWTLPEIRDRRSVVAMSLWTALAIAVSALLLSLLTLPPTTDAFKQALLAAAQAGVAGILTGAVTLFVLPTAERVFGVATGMTLIEYRDPKQKLLREMQQRAPGTYNHSLNVASIAETAADAIGADALLTYVGGLYHDIGKTSKPEYFVENQSGGPNRHEKLSPAMSLLVIIGHVKDGVEIARAYGLPEQLIHFIEGHHGTTLVEYFFHRAKQQASRARVEDELTNTAEAKTELPGTSKPERKEEKKAAEEDRQPEEFDYRYPGPKPRTKEVAILMLSDAVESATRAMSEPTPSRIDTLVRELANKRLADGQFDECDLTLRELQTVVESISRSVSSIHHGRIAYPSGDKPKTNTETKPAPKQATDTNPEDNNESGESKKAG